MGGLVRLSFSIEQTLCDRLQGLMDKAGYSNRSEFIRDMVRSRLVEEAWREDEEALGTITLLYDHHMRQLSARLTAVQHHHHDEVLATTHVHLDHDLCAEMIMVRGRAHVIEHIAEQLRQQKGVLHVAVAISSTGRQLT